VHPQNPEYLKLLRYWYKMKVYEAEALSVDHLDPEKWDIDGGKLWCKIDSLNGKILLLLDKYEE